MWKGRYRDEGEDASKEAAGTLFTHRTEKREPFTPTAAATTDRTEHSTPPSSPPGRSATICFIERGTTADRSTPPRCSATTKLTAHQQRCGSVLPILDVIQATASPETEGESTTLSSAAVVRFLPGRPQLCMPPPKSREGITALASSRHAATTAGVDRRGCGQPHDGHKTMHMDQNQSHRKELDVCLSSSTNISDQSDQEPGKNMKPVHSEEQFPVMENLSDTLDAAWTGEGQSASKDSSTPPMDSSSSIKTPAASGVLQSDDMDYQTWLMSPFLSFYQSFHKNFRNSQKQGNLSEYNPVYILSFRELLHQGGARLLLPITILKCRRHLRELNKVESPVSLPFLDSFSLLTLSSFDEVISESLRGIGSIDESNLSSLGSQSSSSLDQHSYTNVSQVRIIFSDDGPQGKVKLHQGILKGGKESKMDVLVMENLLFRRNITRLYDLKGSCRSRTQSKEAIGRELFGMILHFLLSVVFISNSFRSILVQLKRGKLSNWGVLRMISVKLGTFISSSQELTAGCITPNLFIKHGPKETSTQI
nr:1-phosphatidylinositol-3-phosphate 5-kinase FAB1B-like isoform X1 [Ipomoea batatas]